MEELEKPVKVEKKALTEAQLLHLKKMREKKHIKNEAKKLNGMPTNYKKTRNTEEQPTSKNSIEKSIEKSIELEKPTSPKGQPASLKLDNDIIEMKNMISKVYKHIEEKSNKSKDKTEKINKIYEYVDKKQKKKEEKLKKQQELEQQHEEEEEDDDYSNYRGNYYNPLINNIFKKY